MPLHLPTLRAILDGLDVTSVLEVECGCGENLPALREVLGKDVLLAGVEASPQKLAAARAAMPDATFANGTALELPFPDDSFDVVFVRGVQLRHEHDLLHPSLGELVRVCRRYVLAIEYQQLVLQNRSFPEPQRPWTMKGLLIRSRPQVDPDPNVRPCWLLFEKTPV